MTSFLANTTLAIYCLCTVGLFGILGNLNIVWATVRFKSVRSPCNFLIATIALSDIFHQLGHFILAYFHFGWNDISVLTCFYFQAVPSSGCSYGSVMLFVISLDRLICVLMPML